MDNLDIGLIEERNQSTMEKLVLQVGSRVRITSYGPFRDLRGVVQCVDEMLSTSELSELFCFYLVRLEGAYIANPVWFLSEEVEPITPTN